MKKVYLQTNKKYDAEFTDFIKDCHNIKIENCQILYDFSKRLMNSYGISEQFIQYIYKLGYTDGCRHKRVQDI